ncbi:MAG: hypothetical protein KQJ78_11420 [Deltaproteobacteria bacterium]|nr:hypothetical protein [Deltaproteobacteria bacterium]
MSKGVFQRVAALLGSAGSPSRNADYQDYSGEEGQRVIRLYRLYRSLLKDLEQAAERSDVVISANLENGQLRLELADPRVSYRRVCLVPEPLTPHFLERLAGLGVPLPHVEALSAAAASPVKL